MSAVVIATIASLAAIVGTAIWTQRAMRRDLAEYARQITTSMHRDRGRCGHTPKAIPGTVPVYCELTYGHEGWHRSNGSGAGVTTEWGRKE